MSEIVTKLAGALLDGSGPLSQVESLTAEEKGLLVDALLQGTFPLPRERAGPLLDLCVSISTEINAPLRLYFSLVRRGFLNSAIAPESASRDLGRAKDMLKALGADLAGTYTCSSPVGMALSQIVWLDYLIGSAFGFLGRNDDAASHYSSALATLASITPEGKPGESWYFERKADSEAALRRFGDAAESYRKALTYPEESEPKKRTNLLRSLALALIGNGDFDGAEASLKQAVEAAATAEDRQALAMAQLTLANLYQKYLNRYRDAIASAEAARASSVNEDTARTALGVMGAAYVALGFYTDALRCGQEVAQGYEGEGGSKECVAVSMVAADLSMMGRHVESLSSFRKALEIAQKQGDLGQSSDLLTQIANERSYLGEFEGALADLDRAAAAASQLPDHSREAKCSVLKGNIYLYKLDSLDYAQRSYNAALDQLASVGENEVADPYQHVQALTGLSSTYLAQDDFEGAMACLGDSLEVCGDLEPLASVRAQVLRSMADVYSAQGKKAEAERSQRESAATYEKLGMVRDEAGTYRDLTYTLIAAGDYAGALEAIGTAGRIYAAGNFRDEVLSTVSTKALVLFNQGRWEDAGRAIEEGLESYGPEESDPTLLSGCYVGLSVVARKGGDKAGELSNLLRAAGLLDSVRARLGSGDLKQGFQGNEVTVYGAIVEAYRELGEAERSFEYAERSKSRTLVEDLRTADLRRPPVSDALADEEKVLLDDLRAALTNGPEARARDAERRLKAIWDAMETTSPSPETREYLSLRRGDAISAAEARLLLEGDGKAGIVEYYILEKRLLIYVLTDRERGLQVFSVDVGRQELEDLSKRLLLALQDPTRDAHSALAREMSDRILAPVSAVIGELEHIHFVPHGVLHGLPIHALQLDGQALIDRHTVSYSQSASVLRFLEGKDASPSGALAVGDTTLDLPFARAESLKLADLLGTKAITGNDATKELLTASIGGRRNVSFSCHARFSSDDPFSSGIKLAGGEMLTARDWLTLKTSAELISLSACESAVSSERPGDEMLGLVRSMTFAGARSVTASLWRVDDLATYITMTRFYENMTMRGLDKSHALREAQIYLRGLRSVPDSIGPDLAALAASSSGNFSHPYFWAPFVLMGAW
ncbi:MAG: CHAT domain-containing protein [Thaumarchaeota archaeon]|nr:CHAT domain-containing protein [Nitrososphaerota archaeon]